MRAEQPLPKPSLGNKTKGLDVPIEKISLANNKKYWREEHFYDKIF